MTPNNENAVQTISGYNPVNVGATYDQSDQLIIGDQINIAGEVEGDVIIQQTIGDERQRLIRQALLQTVWQFWVVGVLQRGLFREVYIDIAMEVETDSVELPWTYVLQGPDIDTKPKQGNTSLLDIIEFDKGNQSLLILGASGSGKTTTLLNFASKMIARAKRNDTYPIPLVLNLSSWRSRYPSLDVWIVHEMNIQYKVPKQVSLNLIDEDKLLLLLDGLDEVIPSEQASCVAAINAFYRAHLASIVICSSKDEYDLLPTRLEFQSALALQPLTDRQITTYLQEAGVESGLASQLVANEVLLDLIRNPLMLNVSLLSYGKNQIFRQSIDQPSAIDQKQILDSYIIQMLNRGRNLANNVYTARNTIKYLRWLSLQLMKNGRSIYQIEEMQPSWLNTDRLTQSYYLMSRLVFGLSVGLIVGLSTSLLTSAPVEIILGITGGLICGLVMYAIRIHIIPKISHNWMQRGSPQYRGIAVYALAVGLSTGISNGFVGWLLEQTSDLNASGLNSGLSIGIITGVVASVISWLRSEQGVRDRIQTVEQLNLSGTGVKAGLKNGLLLGLLVGQVFGLIDGVTVWLIAGIVPGILVWLSDTVVVGLLGSAIGVAILGLRHEQIPAKIQPNQGIWLSIRNASRAALLGAVGGSIVGIFIAFLVRTPRIGILATLIVTNVAFFWHGYFTLVQHITLRKILWWTDTLPYKLFHFLDYCVDIVFLRRLGGGYIFTHGLIMEHFADMSDDDIERIITALES